MKSKECKLCKRKVLTDCSHVDCPMRKIITAQVHGSNEHVNSSDKFGNSIYGEAVRRKPNLFDD